MVALLTGAVMFALGLFFGWLLHRERVERALYEDVVRTRDRATTTLAETAARLELADEDMVRLRGQLTAAQHLIDERQAAVAKLERELAGRVDANVVDPGADGVHAAAGAGGLSPVRDEASVTAATRPAEGGLFDQLSLEEEADITEEVVSSASRTVDSGAANSSAAEGEASGEVVGDDVIDEVVIDEVVIDEVVIDEPTALPPPAVEDEASPRGEIGEPLVLEPVDVEPAPATDAIAATDAAEAAVAAGVTDAAEAAVAAGVTEATDVAEARDVAELQTAGDVAAVNPSVPAADDLRRITGVGPALERALQDQGITTFRRLALLDDAAVDDLRSQAPRLVARLRRDHWVSQARRLHIETYGDEP